MKKGEAIERIKKIYTYAPRPAQLKLFLAKFLEDLGFPIEDPLVVRFEGNAIILHGPHGKYRIIVDLDLSKKVKETSAQKNEVITDGLVWIFEDEKLNLQRNWRKIRAKLKTFNA